MPTENEMEKGIQPLDALMTRLNIKNSDLVSVSANQLTFKVVAKGRKGRWLTANAKAKILRAINARCPETPFVMTDLFNYSSRK